MKKLRPSLVLLSEARRRKLEKLARREHRHHRHVLLPPVLQDQRDAAVMRRFTRFNRYSDRRFGLMETISVPESFDLIENAHETLDFLAKIAALANSNRTSVVTLDYTHCTRLGLDAELITAYLTMVMDRRHKEVRGHKPQTESVHRLHYGIGIPKKLGFAPAEQWSDTECGAGRIRVFDSRICKVRGEPVFSQSENELLGLQFTDHLDKCLGDHGRKLTFSGTNRLQKYLGEITDNAEQHAGLIDYTVASFLDNAPDGTHFCEIVIFNFGDTIADSFLRLDKKHHARREISAYVEHHKGGKIFGPGWKEEDLVTLVALQEFISSKNIDASIRRGCGTIEFIGFFQDVHREAVAPGAADVPPPKMSILSGHTQILFDGTYGLSEDRTGRQIIAFNTANDLRTRPDKNYVRRHDWNHFPGTVISLRFPLSKSFITEG